MRQQFVFDLSLNVVVTASVKGHMVRYGAAMVTQPDYVFPSFPLPPSYPPRGALQARETGEAREVRPQRLGARAHATQARVNQPTKN